MTARALQGDRERCLEAGMNDYVSKPVDPQALAETIERWLSGKVRNSPPVVKTKTAPLVAPPTLLQALVFDKTSLMQRLMGDEELAHTVISGFIDDIPDQIQALKNYLKTGDMHGAERQAHTIKGASANIGGEALRAVALEMEKNGKNGDLPAVQACMDDLEAQFERLKKALNKELQSAQNH
jgi:HPt (histidine-containing phosphotransfer) domain-containing protein